MVQPLNEKVTSEEVNAESHDVNGQSGKNEVHTLMQLHVCYFTKYTYRKAYVYLLIYLCLASIHM